MRKTKLLPAVLIVIVAIVLSVYGQGTQTNSKTSKSAKPKPTSDANPQTRSRRSSKPATAAQTSTSTSSTPQTALPVEQKTTQSKPTAPAAAAPSPGTATTVPTSDPEKAKDEHLKKGESYLKESKFKEAVEEFSSAIKIDEKLAEAHWGLAQAYEGLQRYTEMVEELRKTTELAPKNLDARVKLGNLYLAASKGKPEISKEAERLAQEVLAGDPNHIEGHILLGSVLLAQNEPVKSLAEVNRAIELDPNRAESYLALARYYLVTSNVEKAERSFKKAIQVNPALPLVHTEYGKFLVQRNRTQEAEIELRKAVDVGPSDRQALFVLGSFYLIQKQLDKAEEAYIALAGLDKDRPQGRAVLADFYGVTNRPDEAIAIYKEVLAKSPDYKPARDHLDELLKKRGNNQTNNLQFEEALKTGPGANQAPVLSQSDDPVKVLRDQIDAAETPQERVRLQLQLVDLHVANGKKDEALAELHRIAASDAFAPEDIYNAGNSMARLGDMDGAIASYRKAIEQRNGNYSRAYNNLGVVLLRAGRWQESYEALTAALRIEGFHYAEASYNLGRLYATRGENDLAVHEWRRTLKINPNHTGAREALARLGHEGTVQVGGSDSKIPPPPKSSTAPKASDKPVSVSSPTTKPAVVTVERDTYNFLMSARTANERGKVDEAITNYKKAISSNGGYLPPANLELSYLLITQKQYDEALDNLLRVANRDGARFPISYFHLARLYEARGDFKQAETAFGQAAASFQPTNNNQFLLDVSRVREKQGNYQGALEALEQYVERMKQQGQIVTWSDERVSALRQKLNSPK